MPGKMTRMEGCLLKWQGILEKMSRMAGKLSMMSRRMAKDVWVLNTARNGEKQSFSKLSKKVKNTSFSMFGVRLLIGMNNFQKSWSERNLKLVCLANIFYKFFFILSFRSSAFISTHLILSKHVKHVSSLNIFEWDKCAKNLL